MKRSSLNGIIVLSAAIVTCAGTLLGQQTLQTPETLLGAAQHQAEVEGNLEKAIATYKQVVADTRASRAAVATALLRMGECYRELGRTTESRAAYLRVIQEFGDQHTAAESARVRLNATLNRSLSVSRRPVWTGPEVDPYMVGSVSRDGRFLSHEATDGEFYVRELATGARRRLTDRAANAGVGYYSAINADATRVALSWERPDGGVELRVFTTGTSGTAVPRTLYSNEDVIWIRPFDWSLTHAGLRSRSADPTEPRRSG